MESGNSTSSHMFMPAQQAMELKERNKVKDSEQTQSCPFPLAKVKNTSFYIRFFSVFQIFTHSNCISQLKCLVLTLTVISSCCFLVCFFFCLTYIFTYEN